jgi:Holliday junction resolvase-like predicted endonuclease
VFVEVRSRTGEDRGHPLEAITPQKRARVVRAARLYLDAETPAAGGFRFDVVAVTFWNDGRSPTSFTYRTPSRWAASHCRAAIRRRRAS